MPVKVETYEFEGKELELYFYPVPVLHDDFHKAERDGREYVDYVHNGPDYWDDFMMFAKIEDVERAERWYEENILN